MLNLLCHRLFEITQNFQLQEHPVQMEALRREVEHSVVVMESEYRIERYTCGVHAFHLVEHPTYMEIASFGLGRTFAGSEFINYLIGNRLLIPRDQLSVVQSDLIFYFDNGVFRPVGRIKTPDRVVSKWGTGYLYEHGVWEIPSNYGDEVRCFVGPDEDLSFDLFIKYAESEGFTFQESHA